jgi:hypothetical protein
MLFQRMESLPSPFIVTSLLCWPSLYCLRHQLHQACAVLNPPSFKILFRRNQARKSASASGDKITEICSPLSSNSQRSRRENTARGCGGPSPGSSHDLRRLQYVCSAAWKSACLSGVPVTSMSSARNSITYSRRSSAALGVGTLEGFACDMFLVYLALCVRCSLHCCRHQIFTKRSSLVAEALNFF